MDRRERAGSKGVEWGRSDDAAMLAAELTIGPVREGKGDRSNRVGRQIRRWGMINNNMNCIRWTE